MTSSLFNTNFLLVSAATFCFFFSYHLLSPVFPAYLTSLHLEGALLGGLVASFMVASLVVRPFVGKYADEQDKRTLIWLSVVLFMGCPILYTLTANPLLLVLIRLVHGIGFAMFYVASSSFLTDVVADAHRGEGISYFSNSIKLATAFSPALGVLLMQNGWMPQTFWLSSGLAVVALLLALRLGNTHTHSHLERKGLLLNKAAVFPGLVMSTNSIVFGALIPFMPLIATEKNLEAVFLFYPIYAIFLVMSRGVAGALSDRYGRASVILPGMTLVILSLWGMSAFNHPWVFLAFSALYGLGAGTVQPALMAMAIDRSETDQRGSAMATFTMCNDLGIAAGSFFMGSIGSIWTYSDAIATVSGVVCVGWAAYVLHQRSVLTSLFRRVRVENR